MFLRHLYLLSLEPPEHWAHWLGIPVDSTETRDTRIEFLGTYVTAIQYAADASGQDSSDVASFVHWLNQQVSVGTRGWKSALLHRASGNHLAAIALFWEYLHRYVLAARPEWLTQLNAQPIPSAIRNGVGTPDRQDIRNPAHIAALGIEATPGAV